MEWHKSCNFCPKTGAKDGSPYSCVPPDLLFGCDKSPAASRRSESIFDETIESLASDHVGVEVVDFFFFSVFVLDETGAGTIVVGVVVAASCFAGC